VPGSQPDPKGTLREHQPGHWRARAVTDLRPIPSSSAAFVPAASRTCPRFPPRCSMVRRGSTVRVRQRAYPLEVPVNRLVLLSEPAALSTSLLDQAQSQDRRRRQKCLQIGMLPVVGEHLLGTEGIKVRGRSQSIEKCLETCRSWRRCRQPTDAGDRSWGPKRDQRRSRAGERLQTTRSTRCLSRQRLASSQTTKRVGSRSFRTPRRPRFERLRGGQRFL
jgi:hypothetical protein